MKTLGYLIGTAASSQTLKLQRNPSGTTPGESPRQFRSSIQSRLSRNRLTTAWSQLQVSSCLLGVQTALRWHAHLEKYFTCRCNYFRTYHLNGMEEHNTTTSADKQFIAYKLPFQSVSQCLTDQNVSFYTISDLSLDKAVLRWSVPSKGTWERKRKTYCIAGRQQVYDVVIEVSDMITDV